MKRSSCMIIGVFVVLVMAMIVAAYYYYYCSWKHMWSIASTRESYIIHKPDDDTIRVLMIGDSWAANHSWMQMDSFLQKSLEECVCKPVVVRSKGRGGEKSKGIYQLMFQPEGDGTKKLLLSGADYCIVSAGINDAAANWGTKQFCAHYLKIIDFLLANGVCPVVIEIPNVDIKGLYKGKNMKDSFVDFLRSTMTHCGMYNYPEYREALLAMLDEKGLREKVLIVSLKDWYGDCPEMNWSLFLDDGIHLNHQGYELLDVGITTAIVNDLREKSASASVNEPMSKNAQ